jgi:hypothetical protein
VTGLVGPVDGNGSRLMEAGLRSTGRVAGRERIVAGDRGGRLRGSTIDDVIVLVALFMTRRGAGRPRAGVIVGGQYAGSS